MNNHDPNPADLAPANALRKTIAEAFAAPQFEWHSSTIAEDGTTLLVLFDGDDGHTWGFTLDTGKALDGQSIAFRRMD